MKHETIRKIKIGDDKLLVTVRLIPDDEFEKNAIINVESYNSTKEEKELVDNYLCFEIDPKYSTLGTTENNGNQTFTLRVFINN